MVTSKLYNGLLAYALLRGAARGVARALWSKSPTLLTTKKELQGLQNIIIMSSRRYWDHQDHVHIATGSYHYGSQKLPLRRN